MGDPSANIWIFDLERGTRTRLTFDGASHRMASWSADGQRVVFNSQTGATVMSGSTLHTKPTSGGGQDELLLARKDAEGAPSSLLWPQWTPDGRYLVFLEQSGPTGAAIWAMPTSGEKKPFVLVKPESPSGKIIHVRLSPDGHWLAYSAIEGYREEVYVTSFPEGNGRWQISREGGTFPVWRRDGKEIYYLGNDANINAVPVNGSQGEFQVGSRNSCLKCATCFPWASLSISQDGKRFLVFNQQEGSASPMLMVLNWTAELGK